MDFKAFIAQENRLAQALVSASNPDDIDYLTRLETMLREIKDIPKANPEASTIKGGGKNWNWSTVVDWMPIYGIQLNLGAGATRSSRFH